IEVRKDDSGYVLSLLSLAELLEELETVESRQAKIEQEQIRRGLDGLLQAGWTIRSNPHQVPLALQADAIHLSEGNLVLNQENVQRRARLHCPRLFQRPR